MWKGTLVFLLLVAAAFWQPEAKAQSQNSISIDTNEASIAFPDTVTFLLEAQADSEIERVTLIYGTNGRSCQRTGSRQPLDFDAATEISLDWEWELKRSGSLPPGVRIWWQWEIETIAGDLLVSERLETVVTDDRYDWRTLSESGVTVNWYQGSTSFGQAMVNEGVAALDRLTFAMGITRPATITLWIYPAAADVREAVLNSPEWTGGVAFPEYNSTIIGVAPGQDEWAGRVVPHELLHLVLGIRMFNCRGIDLPTWMEEGLARYAENNLDAAELEPVTAAMRDGRLPPLSSLARGFSAYGNSASLAYTQSYAVVSFLYDEYGPESMAALLDAMQGGLRIDPAMQQVFGFDTDGLDVAWRSATGFPATPTAVADALAAQATPTLVPTLALLGPPVVATATSLPAATSTAQATATAVATETPTPLPPSPTGTVAVVETLPSLVNEISPTPTEPSPAASNAPGWMLWGGATLVAVVIGALIVIGLRRNG